MGSPEVDWTLTQLGSVVGAITAPLRRVDRDESKFFEGDIRKRKEDLKKANYVGSTLVDVSNSPIGTEYDHDREAVVGVRIEGLHHSEWGHVDSDGVEGIPWNDAGGLVPRIRSALLAERTWPAAGGDGVTYTHLAIANESPDSAQYRDYYRHDFDLIFHGYEDLP